MNGRAVLRIVIPALLAAGILAVFWLLPVKDSLSSVLQWIDSIGAWGAVVLGAIYVVASVFFVPGTIFTLAAGFLFGLVVGTITISIAGALGATAAFLVGRRLLRRPVERRIAADPRFRAIDRAVRDHGFKIVLLVRLSPIFPFGLINYGFGLTQVRLRQYALASWIGMLPGTVMYVYLGSAFKNLAALLAGRTESGTLQTALYLAGLVITIVATVFITRVARRALDEAVAASSREADVSPGEPDPAASDFHSRSHHFDAEHRRWEQSE